MTAPVYQWQPTSLNIAERLGIEVGEVVRFDQNTSPNRPEWAGSVAGNALERINEYPYADYRTLREAAADYVDVSAEWIVPGAGADELIGLCAATFLPFQGLAATAPPTYGMYAIATAHRHARLLEIPRRAGSFDLDSDALVEAAQKADLVWLCEPNNPTGNRSDTNVVVEVLEAAVGTVILDAAYAEFAGDQWARWVERYPNLVVLRTLSKAFSLAGIRLGYAVAQPHQIAEIDARRPPGSVSTVSAALGEYALRHPEPARTFTAWIGAERQRMANALAGCGFEVFPSHANFVLAHLGPRAADVADELMWTHGLVVRTFPNDPRLAEHIRVTVRSPKDNDRLLGLLKGMLT